MKFPFLNSFRKKSDEEAAPAPIVSAPPVPEKTGGSRLGKTVMPSASRNAAPAAEPATPPPAAAPVVSAPTPAPPLPAPIAIAPTPSPAPAAPRTVSFALPTAAAPSSAAPVGERVIELPVGDLIGRFPPTLAKADGFDRARRIRLPLADVEKGMSTGRPVAALASIYEQAPEVFARPLASYDPKEIPLPISQVLQQFDAFKVRADQEEDADVPQVVTPFLKVTQEDNARFGTEIPQLQSSPTPPIRLQPATAANLAAAEPEPAAPEKATPTPIRISLAPSPTPTPASPATAPDQTTPTPAAVPFSLLPNGADAPAECVPASGEPSVPTSFPPAAPPRVPFKITAPSDDLRPKSPISLTPAPAPAHVAAASTNGQKISLALQPVLKNLPPFQLKGVPGDVAADARIELPFSVIEPQLALGRVAVSPRQFQDALPEEYRQIFDSSEANTPVALPLQEVLKNLPSASIKLREDQHEDETGEAIQTPFSMKAAEDAKRFAVATPVAKPEPAVAPAAEPATARTPLQSALDTDAPLDPKAVIVHASRLPGVRACAIMFEDGLSLAGNFPAELQTDGLCAMAPSFLQRLRGYTSETQLGSADALTIFCDQAPVTFFMHEKICLAALHASAAEISGETRDKLRRTTTALAEVYAQPPST